MSARHEAGYWTKGKGLEAVTAFVRGKATLEQAGAQVRLEGQDEKGATADIRWYARDVRKALGLPSLREAASAVKAKQELAQK